MQHLLSIKMFEMIPSIRLIICLFTQSWQVLITIYVRLSYDLTTSVDQESWVKLETFQQMAQVDNGNYEKKTL